MAKKILGPWSVQFPVRFHSGGDTTAQAFGKHINEIDRIYGLLNSLDVAKIGNEELTELITSIQNMLANQKHNALKDIQGGSATERYHLTKTQVDKLNDAPAGNDHNTSLTGHQGGNATERYHLTKAQVDKVNGAAAAGDVIKNHNSLEGLDGGGGGKYIHLTQAQLDKLNGAAGAGDIIKNHNSLEGLDGGGGGKYFHLTEAQMDGLSNLITNPPKTIEKSSMTGNGYALLSGGLLINWGTTPGLSSEADAQPEYVTFPMAFTAGPWAAVVSAWVAQPSEDNDWWYQVSDVTVSGMKVWRMTQNRNTATLTRAHWIAIGKGN